ncbi:MAG TPA: alpha/beta hydrolase [Nocardioidaceae bacterium]|nr:alpha/beta hydrolase [Nocardioidaceae bacterium]
MRNVEGGFTGASGEQSYWQAWLPDETKAVVLLSHGVSEHSGRYAHVGTRLADAGYAVYAIDHHGHGRSGGTPGNIGRMAWVVEDLHTLRRLATEQHPDVPVFVLAHSLGGLIALDYVTTKSQAGLAGLLLSGAAVDPAVGSRIERAVAPLVSRFAPNLRVTALSADAISRDPAVIRAYVDDPLVYTGKVRARTGAEALAAVARVQERVGSLTLPLLAMHGSKDTLTSPSGSELVYERVRSDDKTLKLYDGLFHEIFNEPEQDSVLDDVVGWLDKRV